MLDVTRPDGVKAIVEAAFKHFGRLDIVVNNAGFGLLGVVEEVSLEEYREVMETNFYGALQVTQAVLPYLRAQRQGHILQMSSTSGFRGTTGFGAYNASKFALEGMSEALAQEVAPYNIKVTIVEPGPLRTNFAGAGIKAAKKHIKEYDTTAGAFTASMRAGHNEQAGDPAKAAKVLMELVNTDNLPLHLPLGKFAFDVIRAKLQKMQQELDKWESFASKTSFET
ncbi:SDR family NAD(P)-dependent oxidoreductase [Pontibacter silvestris]|uniref:SDR family NAD(P)-dependent oxidoreductase n=1 Tax=Pontibacter silvestris TaxID=2305183 RepID=A0ABW4WVU5_9BACT|nr:SDR family NAD(P)-dependent oxidoreductase [Pontibacter silvestris]MCC9138025.1 SDR family NAD(P)-dependent oxidoreductase [Pontibacter silvestris]